MADPISNPATPPIQPTPSPDRPGLGSEDLTQSQKPFTLGPESSQRGVEAPASQKPTPMEVSRDRDEASQNRWTPEEMDKHLKTFQKQLVDANNKLKSDGKNLSDDHVNALKKLTDKLTPDVNRIAKTTNSTFTPPDAPKKPEGLLGFITNWVDGAQGTMNGALTYLQGKPDVKPADFLQLQYSVQRASQRGELFASIIGSTVSGIKTLMSTQLG